MFALGCIIYEIVTGEKLFVDDWAVRSYSLKGDPIFPELWPPAILNSRLYALGKLTSALLESNPAKRPSAVETLKALSMIRLGLYQEVEVVYDEDPLYLVTDPITTPQEFVPKVQPRYQLPKIINATV